LLLLFLAENNKKTFEFCGNPDYIIIWLITGESQNSLRITGVYCNRRRPNLEVFGSGRLPFITSIASNQREFNGSGIIVD